jgi:hypothetical protein
MTARGHRELARWIDDLNANERHGVFIAGQSLFMEAASGFGGKVADYELPNYDDYHDIARQLERAERQVVCVTGDVHWGRVVEAAGQAGRGGLLRPDMYEVITSPAALVSTVAADQAKRAWHWVRGWFTEADPWPRHSNPAKSPHYFPHERKHYRCRTTGELAGDQIGLLRFVRLGGKLCAFMQLWSLDPSSSPVTCELFRVPIPREVRP